MWLIHARCMIYCIDVVLPLRGKHDYVRVQLLKIHRMHPLTGTAVFARLAWSCLACFEEASVRRLFWVILEKHCWFKGQH